MSRKAERKQKKLEKLKSEMRTAWIVAAVGFVLLAAGIVGVILAVREYREYKETEKAFKVSCEITSVDIRTAENEYDTKITVYDAKFTFSVDGKEYKGEKRFSDKVEKGDRRDVLIYKKTNGDYAVAKTTNEVSLIGELAAPAIGLVVGLVLALAGAWVALGNRREMKAK